MTRMEVYAKTINEDSCLIIRTLLLLLLLLHH